MGHFRPMLFIIRDWHCLYIKRLKYNCYIEMCIVSFYSKCTKIEFKALFFFLIIFPHIFQYIYIFPNTLDMPIIILFRNVLFYLIIHYLN